jgi:hypothetical protein
MGWCAKQAAALSIVGLFAAEAHGQTLYCPWADAVLRLTISEDKKAVTAVSSLGDVPTPGEYVLSTVPPPRPGGTVLFRFVIDGGAYTYIFEIQNYSEGRYLLSNRRVGRNGEMFEQEGYCFVG